jgi:DNA-binding GntR family transcriptional regulator
VSQTVNQNHTYLIRRNGIYYFSRRVPSVGLLYGDDCGNIQMSHQPITIVFSQHEKIITAISQRVPELSASLMREHL